MVVVVVASACGSGEPPPPKNEFEAFERRFVAETRLLATALRREGKTIADKDIPTSYRAVFVGPSGVFVDRQLVATLAELDAKRAAIVAAIDANRMLLPSYGITETVVFDLDAEPAGVAVAALRLFADHETLFQETAHDPELPERASRTMCRTTLRDRARDTDLPRLSVVLDPGRIFVGLSVLREFQVMQDTAAGRDFDKLESALEEQKHGPLFSERVDLELAAAAGTSRDVLAAFTIACQEGFTEISVLPREQLGAIPQLE